MYRWQHWFRFARKTGAPAHRRERLAPRLEILEDRCVPSFVPTTYPTADGSQTTNLAVGDLTGNGIPDLVMSQGHFMVGVYLGNGDGSFQPAGSYVVSGGGDITTGGVNSIQIADLRGNGIADIVTSGGIDGVSVLLGNGDGSFKLRRDYLAGEVATGLVVTDLNGDGIPDIATANFRDGTVSVLLGNGDGTFKPATTYAVGTFPLGIAAGLFGTDSGVPDLAVVNGNSNTVSVLVNHGDGTFAQHVDYPVGVGPGGIALGDFAHTGTLDIAVANNLSNSVSLLIGNGDHTFQRARHIPVPAGTNRVVAADFNNDGNLDLAVTLPGPNRVSVLLDDGTGNFAPPVDFPTDNDPVGIAAADLTNDGNADLVTTNFLGRSYTTLLNDGMWDSARQNPCALGNAVAGNVPDPTLAELLVSSGSPARSPAGVSGLPEQSVRLDSTPPGGNAAAAQSEAGSRPAPGLLPSAFVVPGSAEAPDLGDSTLGIIGQPWIDVGLLDVAFHRRR
jgi:hypothetical protein